MYHTDDFLERIRQAELNKLNVFSFTKLVSNMHIETTKEVEGATFINEGLIEKKFKHDSSSKYIFSLFAVFILSKAIKDTFFKSNTDIAFLVLEYILSVTFFYVSIRQFFFAKPSNYNILIDKIKIEIREQIFLWKDIYETAILTKGGGKLEKHFLVIAMKDMKTYEIFELQHFTSYWSFSATLSKYIEHFKSSVRH